jgi:hypothetical protein
VLEYNIEISDPSHKISTVTQSVTPPLTPPNGPLRRRRRRPPAQHAVDRDAYTYFACPNCAMPRSTCRNRCARTIAGVTRHAYL